MHDEVGVLHTDVKPENVLLAGPAPVGRVKLVDLGTAFYVGRQGARDIQTREYRCPEGVLGLWPFGPAADVWSVGCLVFELLTGETLFDPQSPRPGEPFSKDESHLAQAVELLGPVPAELVRRSPRAARWFRGDGSALRNIAIAPPPPGVDAIARVLEDKRRRAPRRGARRGRLLRALLRYEPDARASRARRALDLPWLADGGAPRPVRGYWLCPPRGASLERYSSEWPRSRPSGCCAHAEDQGLDTSGCPGRCVCALHCRKKAL